MDDQHDDDRCPDCGNKMHDFDLPRIGREHFTSARRLAAMVWDAASIDEAPALPISVVCLTAALLLKRAAVSLGVPLRGLESMAGLYLEVAHQIILKRRTAAAVSDDGTLN